MLRQDIRAALRTFRLKPALALAVVGILALGIGANLAVFQLAWGLLYRPLPYASSERLVRVWGESRDGRTAQLGFSIPRFEHVRAAQTSFAGVAIDVQASFTLTGIGDPVQVSGRRVSAGYFDVLGVLPVAGRGFREDEEVAGGVAIVTPGFRQKRLAGMADVLGRTITIDGEPHTIVGIVPELPAADGGTNEIYVTRPYEIGVPRALLQRGISFLRFAGRLREDVSLDQARAEMAVLDQSYRRDHAGNADVDWTMRVRTIREDVSGNFRSAVTTLMGAVALVLLLACGNVANLLTGRALARTREVAVRTALGASRWRVLRLFVVETTLLSGAGAILGLVLAVQVVGVLPRLGAELPLDTTSGVPWSQYLAASLLALLAGAVTGVLPAMHATTGRASDTLRGSRGIAGDRQVLQRGLVSVQVAVSLVLLFGALLLVESFRHVSKQDPGFDATGVLMAVVNPPPRRYPTPAEQYLLYERLREQLSRAPGVTSAALAVGLPLSSMLTRAPYARADDARQLHQRPLGPTRSVTPGYFDTLRVPLLAGRDFTTRDDEEAPPVIILSASTARQLFPNEDPIGQSIVTGSQNGGVRTEVVGIVGDVRSQTLTRVADVELYRPLAQRVLPFAQIALRTAVPPESVVGTVRELVQEVDPELALTSVATLEEILGESLGQRTLLMSLLVGFAVLALVLAAAGIYAVVSFTVGRRTKEIGVRMALGATPIEVVRLITLQGLWPVVGGAVLGLAALPWVSRWVAEQLFEVSPLEPSVLGSMIGLMTLAAAAATVMPALRAARVAPVQALRAD